MNDMFTFERPEWELLTNSLRAGDSISAVVLLSALQTEDENGAMEALETLTGRRIQIDISSLPENYGEGELEKRLRFEGSLVSSGNLIAGLSEDDPLRIYLEELAAIPAQGDTELLTLRLREGDDSVAQNLLNLYLHRAVEIAAENTGRGVLLQDMIQEGSLGLWQAIAEYCGGDLSEQIDWRIRQSIAAVILMQYRETDVLSSMQSHMEAYRKADRKLLAKLGRNATVEEMALELGITPEQADVIRDMMQNASDMEKVKRTSEQQDPEEEQAVEDTAYFQSRQKVDQMLSELSEQEALIISLRFGLDGNAPMTAEAVADKLRMTAQQVVDTEASALLKMRNS